LRHFPSLVPIVVMPASLASTPPLIVALRATNGVLAIMVTQWLPAALLLLYVSGRGTEVPAESRGARVSRRTQHWRPSLTATRHEGRLLG